MKKQYLEVGKIVSMQGIKGEVRVVLWCDGVDFLHNFNEFYTDNGTDKLVVEKIRPHKQNLAVVKFSGIENIEMAAPLINKILYINHDDVELDEGSFFFQDLIGLKVKDTDTGEDYGILSEISQTGANDVYHIKKGKVVRLIPAIPDVVIKTDLDEAVMEIRPLKGLFDVDNN